MNNTEINHRPKRYNPQNDHFAFRLPSVAVLLAGLCLSIITTIQAQTVPAPVTQAADAPVPASTKDKAKPKDDASATIPISTAPAPKGAPEDLGATIIQAQLEIADLDQAKSISQITGRELSVFHVQNFRDIVLHIGNIRTTWQNPNTASFLARGLGWAAGAGVLDPSVGATIDGVSEGITSIAALSNFTDIESVKVTRGPSGFDGGKNFNVGTVSITSSPASFNPEGRIEVTFGQLHSITGSATVGGPIIDGLLAYRISLHRETADGAFPNKNDTQYTWRNTDRTNVKTQFLLTPNQDLQAQLIIDVTPTGREICENCFAFRKKTPAYYDNRNAAGNLIAVDYTNDAYGKIQRRWFQQKGSYTVDDYYAQEINTILEYPNTYATAGVTLNVTDKIDNGLNLTSITGYRNYGPFSQGAGDHTQFNWEYPPSHVQSQYRQLSQELRLDWDISDRLSSRTGLYIIDYKFPKDNNTERYGPDGGAWYATAAQYTVLDPVNASLPNAVDNSGYSLLKNSVDGLVQSRQYQEYNRSAAIYTDNKYKVTKQLSLDAGFRLTHESRQTEGSNGISDNGFGAELNPVNVNNVQLGGFASSAFAVKSGVATGGTLLASNTAAQLALADFVAQKYFSATSYSALTDAQRVQVAAAKAIRLGRINGYNTLFLQSKAQGYNSVLPAFSFGPTYQISDTETVYASFKHGEKAGVSQFFGGTADGGQSLPVKKETTNAYEIGTKSLFLDKTLIFNSTVYLQQITNYIQNGATLDPYQTALNAAAGNTTNVYVSTLVNVPKVETKGVEVDLAYTGIKHANFRFSGAYTDATYKDFKFASPPGELSGDPTHPYYDATGKTLSGAPKWSGNLYADYSRPIGSKVIHANINYNFQTGYYADPSGSRYSFTKYRATTDINIGIGRVDRRFDVSLLVKNAFNTNSGIYQAWTSYKPSNPRWVGVVFSAELF